ncbi:hypothetical protein AKJ37_00130 [candidate division MSBL1 archaeon SCGC-AAA259I09]|uniref:HicB-like antitoxin of toxin-antitoxin system domain-containing protein n=3 Tax=candidate division MSBL1 TaxID=215777 RepID=A0A133UW72_9EURY|nr:hypothetical protein AKJ61_00455 [candidate division MSBL1 archaeon SCGC-AAA259B11]KXA98428.1 hypothetical protein AKJ37_00130 [candidate division MSBL1 archaeon SCGC-AAA259I09]KXB00381.1 hypothetical protein AKJ40_01405 [candidate division MSBL1 archaeon SCGC-AAA259M10]
MTTKIEAPTEESPYLVWKEGDLWIAKDHETGVADQGETPDKALKNLEKGLKLRAEALEQDDAIPVSDAPWLK